MTAPVRSFSDFQNVRSPQGEHKQEKSQLSFTKVFDPRSYRAAFADRWSCFLHKNYLNPEEVAHCFGVRFQTAVNWWNGVNRPSGDVVALAALRHGDAFTEHMGDAA